MIRKQVVSCMKWSHIGPIANKNSCIVIANELRACILGDRLKISLSDGQRVGLNSNNEDEIILAIYNALKKKGEGNGDNLLQIGVCLCFVN